MLQPRSGAHVVRGRWPSTCPTLPCCESALPAPPAMPGALGPPCPEAHPVTSAPGPGPTPATSAPRLGSPLLHLHRPSRTLRPMRRHSLSPLGASPDCSAAQRSGAGTHWGYAQTGAREARPLARLELLLCARDARRQQLLGAVRPRMVGAAQYNVAQHITAWRNTLQRAATQHGVAKQLVRAVRLRSSAATCIAEPGQRAMQHACCTRYDMWHAACSAILRCRAPGSDEHHSAERALLQGEARALAGITQRAELDADEQRLIRAV